MKNFINILLVTLSTVLLVACSKEVVEIKKETIEKSSTSVIEEIITFTNGVDKAGITNADEDNYANIEGVISDIGPVYVIYEGTVLDEIPVENDGSFIYYSKTNEITTMITFSTDDLKFGQKNINISDLNVAKIVNIVPNSEYISKMKSELISGNNPEEEASNIQKNYYPSSEINLIQEQYADGFQDVYAIGEDVSILLTENKKIQQIVFHNLKKEEVINILKDYEYPDTSSIDSFLDENEHYFDPGYNNETTFTYNNDIGVHLSAKSLGTKKLKGYNPFTMVLVCDEDRLEWFKERY